MAKEERLQKLIAAAGLSSRRGAEVLITQGRVSVNGRVVTELGSKADPERDSIKVDGRPVRQPQAGLYILLNKPRGVICTLSDPQGRTRVTDLVKVRGRVYPVGRLDYNTEGLILLTNDGSFARTVSGAGEHIPKVYEVKVKSTPDEEDLERLRQGIRLRDGTQYGACRITRLREGNNAWLEVTLMQGRNLQIRKMFEAIRCPVLKLRRRRIGFLTDEGLPVGRYRLLASEEVQRLLHSERPGGVRVRKPSRRSRGPRISRVKHEVNSDIAY
jgi:23S rRNA pseudouridine2605 synthase